MNWERTWGGTWEISGYAELEREVELAYQRKRHFNQFPNGFDNYVNTIRDAQRNGRGVRIAVERSIPFEKWYIELM